jgi:PKHD-type hydroxylase
MIVSIPDILTFQQLKAIRAAIARAEFRDGGTTAGPLASRVKHNLELDPGTALSPRLTGMILEGFASSDAFKRTTIARTVLPPLISRYVPGMEYGLHVDSALMGREVKVRTDQSVTLFLSDPGDYDGGELLIQHGSGEEAVKLPAGSAVVYPSGALHRVAPVTRGERLAAITWVQSFIRDPAKREVLHDLDIVCTSLRVSDPDSENANLAHKTYFNLMRLWSEL